ncbi:hypothetical protein SAPIO_CDS6438 [Scedosporium apiospermum]|uniref:Uncharacterized protein n=1 Tax=Pseudallescheria apiosperma TaxID=563466 RepID=A0A084G3X1_PSEDA|nr:uncharacterized protein SAPIO_CDS6438 [Scedosporium apiospermum]KEZ42033.1 hypothetical protein SAPIO_CDS6438 [Scedosporium apiospermum]
MELLLQPLDLDAVTESGLLSNGPLSPDWHDPHIQASLRMRVGHEHFPWLIGKFRRLDEIIRIVSSVLPIRNGKVDLPSSETVDFTFLRLAVSFTGKRQLLVEVEKINESISKFLERDLRCAQATLIGPAIMSKGRKTASAETARPFLNLQSQASRLCSILDPLKWPCSCGNQHRCGIATFWSYDTAWHREGSLNLLLGNTGQERLLKVGFKEASDLGPGEGATAEKIEGRFNISQISQLKEEFRSEPDYKKRIKMGKEHKVAALATPCFNTVLLPFKRSSETKWQPRKANKLTINNTTSAGAVGDAPGHNAQFASSPTRSVTPRSSTPDAQPAPEEITCGFFSDPLPSRERGYIKDGDKIVSLRIDTDKCLGQIQGLGQFLHAIPYLDQRIRLSIKLAYTILSLGTSVWFPQPWSGETVLVSSEHPSVPFVTHNCIREALHRTKPPSRPHAEMAVLTVGIVLLQLIFQQTIEEQPFFDRYRFSGEVTEWTLRQAAMKWQEQVEVMYGSGLADAISRCVAFNFAVDPDLGKAEFVHEVLEAVVEPLEMFSLRF